eukprot:Phypoly_transcript_00145.p1 GENE.Phypoly_transcript_00145~~Phypoly_transcript_00145.p1  ORF type:complete len:2067 (+),score=239.37 Phypoly_transcript_00145:161-6361(+)
MGENELANKPSPQSTMLLFCDTFVHSTLSEHVDSITFSCPISIKQFRVVANNQNPHPKKLDFYGRTNPKSFWISVFSKQRTPPEEGWTIGNQEGKDETHGYYSFSPVADPFPYKEAIEDTFVPRKECVTDTIAIRGSYHALSLCIYGAIHTPPSILHLNPHAQDNLSTATSHLQLWSPPNLEVFSEPHLNLAGDCVEHYHESMDEQYNGQHAFFNVKQESGELEQADQEQFTKSLKMESGPEPQKLESEYSEELEVEDDFMASFLNPLDCCFGPVHNVFGANSDANPVSMVALCLMAFCNSMHEYRYRFTANHTIFGTTVNGNDGNTSRNSDGDGENRDYESGDIEEEQGRVKEFKDGDENMDQSSYGADTQHSHNTCRNTQAVYHVLGNVPDSVMEGLNSICLLMERMANDQALWDSYSCEDHHENEALNGSIATGILGLFSVLEYSATETDGEEDLELSPQKITTSLCILKMACFALTMSMKASASFATEFCARGGMNSLLKIQQLPQFVPLVPAKQALLLAISSSITHPPCMAFFLHEKLEGTNLNDALGHQADEENSESRVEPQNITGYEYTVSMLAGSQVPAIFLTIQEILQLANFYNVLVALQSSVGVLCESTPTSDVFHALTLQLQTITDLLTNNTPTKRSSDYGSLNEPPFRPTLYSVLLQQIKFVHLLALIISSPHVTGAMQSYGLLIYTGVCKCVLILLNSAQLTKVLLGSNSDVLSMLIRSLILISESDFTAGDPKPCIQFSDLLPLPSCIANPNSVTPLNLAFLLAYHLQSLCELEGLFDSSLSNSLDDEVGTLHSLYCMTFQDLGRYAVASALAVALSSRSTSFPTFNMTGAPLDDTGLYISHIFGEVERINAELDCEDHSSRTQNLFMQNFRRFIDPPPDGMDIQTVPTVYAISLLQQAVMCEELTDFVATIGSTLYQAITQWDSKSTINAELKGRLQLVLDWLRPAVILKETGVVGLVNSLSIYALPIRERPHNAVLPPSLGTPPSTPPSVSIPSIADTPPVTPAIPPASPLPIGSDPADAQKTPTPTQPPTPSASTSDTADLRLTTQHLSALIITLRLLETEESPSAFVAIAQIDATHIITELLCEVTTAMAQAIRTNEDEKRWLIVKRERQFLQLAVACLKVMYNIVRKFLAVGLLLSPNEIKHIIDSLLQLYTTLSQHSLFPLLNNDSASSVLSSGGSSNSGHFPGLYKTSRTVIDILCIFVLSGQRWSHYVFSVALLNAIDLPRNFFGGAHLLSNLIAALPKDIKFISTTLPSAQDTNKGNATEPGNAPPKASDSMKDLSFDVQFFDEEEMQEPSLLTSRLSAFTAALVSSSSQLVYEQLCHTTKSIVSKGNSEACAVIFPLVDILEAINNSNKTRTTTTEPTPSPPTSTSMPKSNSVSASASASASASTFQSPAHPSASPASSPPSTPSVYFTSRLLNLLSILIVTPSGKSAFLQKKTGIPILLRYIHQNNLDTQATEVGSKHQTLALAILHCILSPHIPSTVNFPTNQLQLTIKILFKMFRPASLSHNLHVATTCLHFLLLLSSQQETLQQLFLVTTRRVASTSQKKESQRPSLFWNMLRYFSSYLEQQLSSTPKIKQPDKACADTMLCATQSIPNPLLVTMAILQSLLTIIEHMQSIPDLDSENCSNNSPVATSNWKDLVQFVDFFSTRSSPHPLAEISANLQKHMEKVGKENSEFHAYCKSCHAFIQHIMEQMTVAGKVSFTAQSGNMSNDVVMNDNVATNNDNSVNPVLRNLLYEQSMSVTCNMLDDNDFMNDLYTPTAEVLHVLQYLDAPAYEMGMNTSGSAGGFMQSNISGAQISGSTCLSDTDSPNAKKFRHDPPMVGVHGITMQRTPLQQTLHHNTFRARQPNTSRPPSTHVDTFVKKTTGPDPPGTKYTLSNNNLKNTNNYNNNNTNINNNKTTNIKDILYMDAKTRELRQYSSAVQKYKDLTPNLRDGICDHPILTNKRQADNIPYFNTSHRDSADRYGRDKYRTPITLFHPNTGYSRTRSDFRESNRLETKSPTKSNSLLPEPYRTPFPSYRTYDQNTNLLYQKPPTTTMRNKRY